MLNSNALTTVERLANFLGIDVPTSGSVTEMQLEILINAVSGWVQKTTGITFKKATYSNELYDTEKSQTLNLHHYPVLSNQDFAIERRTNALNEDDWEILDSNLFVVDYEAGIVTMMAGVFLGRARAQYRVSYTAGYDFDNVTTFLGNTEAADMELAVLMILKDMYNSQSVNYNVKSEKIGDYSITYGGVIQQSLYNNPVAMATIEMYQGLGGIDADTGTLGVLTPLHDL